MHIRVLDLDGSVSGQRQLMAQYRPTTHDLRWWGPRIRLGCSHGRFRRFESALPSVATEKRVAGPTITFYGSGDFHHVSLALLRRLRQPCNLLVLDNHPDWMRGLPFLHCGTWLCHAARLPQLGHVFHVGGNVDFDNGFRKLAPWPLLRSGKVTVLPAVRYFRRGAWTSVPHEPVRPGPQAQLSVRRLHDLLYSYRAILKSRPLYISLDKDVMIAEQAPVNWDSGQLNLGEVEDILRTFIDAANGDVIGMDIVGDWSPVRTQGLFRHVLHWTEHPPLDVSPTSANHTNQHTNLLLLKALTRLQARSAVPLPQAA